MNRVLSSLKVLVLLYASMSFAQNNNGYRVELDLRSIKDDQLLVTVYTPETKAQFVEYHMAKIIPGTYEESDFGRFVNRFEAYDDDGAELDFIRLDTNRWRIRSEGQLHKVRYWVHDTFDRFDSYGKRTEDYIFEPGGTNFDKLDNIFILNTFGFVGYLESLKNLPYQLEVIHGPRIYGATSLKRISSNDTLDVFTSENFNFLADEPIMYSLPDTVTRKIANADVMVASYSPNKQVSSKEIMDKIYDLMIAQAAYLGGELPVDRYVYLIYLVDNKITPFYGALEHSYSTLFYLFENQIDFIGKTIRDIAAHEFFHIVTPLTIHSEEIGNFDFIDPKMSEHLWLYEGVTEYSSIHVQVKYGLSSLNDFIEEIRQKLYTASRYPDISFTKMSESILEPEYASMFPNVYAKGALIALCLDLYLLKYSEGSYDLQDLMRDLSKKYGKNKAFKDEELFRVIEELTFPEVRDFLETYVKGSEKLPVQKVFNWVGIAYINEGETSEITFGNVGLQRNEDGQLIITDISAMDTFGEQMKYKEGDIILSINGEKTSSGYLQDIIQNYLLSTNPGDKVKVEVLRLNKAGKFVRKTLKAKAFRTTRKLRFELEIPEEITNEQQELLINWLTPDQT